MCKCLTMLSTPQGTNKGYQVHWVDGAILINNKSGESRTAPGLRALKEGKDGRLLVCPDFWLEIKFCPLCGSPVEEVRLICSDCEHPLSEHNEEGMWCRVEGCTTCTDLQPPETCPRCKGKRQIGDRGHGLAYRLDCPDCQDSSGNPTGFLPTS